MDAVRLDISSGATEALRKSREFSPLSPKSTAEPSGFERQLSNVLGQADGLIKRAEHQAEELAAGRGDSIDTIIAMSKADLALRHVVTLRNRALEAYQEIMRLPL